MILIDSREPEELVKLVGELKIASKVIALEAGDYCFGETGIERKSMNDLWNSITPPDPSRLWRELGKIKHAYAKPILAVIGMYPYRYTKVKYSQVIGAIAATVFSWGIPVMMFANDVQFVEAMRVMYMKSTVKKPTFKPLPKKHFIVKDVREEMLCCLPGIGRITAKRILKDYPSPKDWIVFTEKILKKYRLRKKSKKILRCLGIDKQKK